MFDGVSTTPAPTPPRPGRPGIDDDGDGGYDWDSTTVLGSFSVATWIGIIVMVLTLLNVGQVYLRKYFPERFQQCKVPAAAGGTGDVSNSAVGVAV